MNVLPQTSLSSAARSEIADTRGVVERHGVRCSGMPTVQLRIDCGMASTLKRNVCGLAAHLHQNFLKDEAVSDSPRNALQGQAGPPRTW